MIHCKESIITDVKVVCFKIISSGTILVTKVVALFLALATTVCAYPGVPSKIGDLTDKWAPLVKFAQNGEWKPSSVDYFLSHCKLEGCNSELTSSSLERCNSAPVSSLPTSLFMVKTQAAQIMPCQHTSFIESILNSSLEVA